MNLNDKATKLQNRLIKDGTRKLSKILRRIKLPLDFNRSLEENIFDVNNVFTPISEFLLSYAETVSLNAIEFSKQQLRELSSKKYTVKSTDIEITVNWAMVDQNVISFLRRGDDFNNPYFDIVTQAISNGNRNWLRDEYSSFVLGEKNLKEAYDRLRNGLTGPQRANLIVRTEMTSVWANAQQEAYRSAGTIKNAWETRNDGPRVCPICQPLNGLEAVIGQPFGNTRITKPAAHIGCILPGNVVNAPFGIDAMAKSFYDGLAVEITVSNGSKLTVTQNHPILTTDGWIAANLLCEGMNVISAIDSEWVSSTINPDDQYMPSQVEEVFNSFIERNPNTGTIVPATPKDFHGDGASIKGNIDVVLSNSLLLGVRDCQHTAQDIFNWADKRQRLFSGTSLFASFVKSGYSTLAFGVGSKQHSISFIGSSLIPSNNHSITSTTLGIPVSREQIRNVLSTAFESSSKLFDRKTAFMQSDQFIDSGWIKNEVSLSSQWGTVSGQPAVDSITRDTILLRKFLRSHAGQVTVSNIVNIRQFNFSGHVYDLQSDMYQLYTCNGILVKNCRCWLSPVPMTDEEIEELINGKRKVPETISKIKVKGKVITPPTMPDRPKTTTEFLSSLQKIEDSKDKLHDDLVKEEVKEVKLLRKLAKERDKNRKIWEKNSDTEVSETYTKYQESVKEYEKQITKVSKISNDRFNIDNVVRQKQRELLYSDYLSNNQVKYLDPSLKNNPSFQSGMEEFNKLVPDYLLKNKQVEFDLNTNYPFTKNIGTDRSWFSPNNNVVYFNPNVDTGVVIHELSHYLDWDNQKVRSMVSTYLSSRTVGEQAVSLDSLYPNRGFASHEMTKKDQFLDAYMGKEYSSSKGTLTEITSMGLERIWRNPLKFIKEDPDYFEFIVSKVLNRY